MALRFVSEPPPSGLTLVRAGLARRAAGQSPLARRGVDLAGAQPKPPLALYDLRADEIATGRGLTSARATGFYYLVEAGGEAVAAAEVHTDPSGTATLLANLNYGAFVGATASAIVELTNMDTVRTGSYEARMLRLSAIGLMAIWLRADTGPDKDIIYPLSPAPNVLRANTTYDVDDFFEAILPNAQQQLVLRGSIGVLISPH